MSDPVSCFGNAVSAAQVLACVAPQPYGNILAGLGALVVAGFGYVGKVYLLRGHALKLKTTRLRWVRESLRSGKHIDCPALLKELEFQVAYGYRYDEDEIVFATARINPSQILHDIRYGRPHVRFDATKNGYVESPLAQDRFWNMNRRIRVTGAVAFGLWMLFFLGVVGLFFYPIGAALLVVESVASFFLLLDVLRGLNSAKRLCELAPDRIRLKSKRKAKPSVITEGSSSDAAVTGKLAVPELP